MGAAVALRNVVGEALHGFSVAVVPLHGDFHADGAAYLGSFLGLGIKNIGVQHTLAAVDVFDKAFHPAGEGEVFFLALTLIHQADLDAVVEEGKLAQALGQHFVVEIDRGENLGIWQEVHLGAAFIGLAGNRSDGDFHAIDHLRLPVLQRAADEFEGMHLAVAPHHKPQPLRQGVDAAHTHAVQAAGDLVAVLVELAPGVQLGESDFGRAALGLVLIVHLHAGRNAAAVVGHADGVVGVDGDDDVITKPGQGFVDGVVDDFEHQMMQAGAV